MLSLQLKAVHMHQNIILSQRDFSGAPIIVVEHREIKYLKNAHGVLRDRQQSSAMTVTKNYFTILYSFRMIF